MTTKPSTRELRQDQLTAPHATTRHQSQDWVGSNGLVNASLNTVNEDVVTINVQSPDCHKNLIDIFVLVDNVPLLLNTRQSSSMNLALCLTVYLSERA